MNHYKINLSTHCVLAFVLLFFPVLAVMVHGQFPHNTVTVGIYDFEPLFKSGVPGRQPAGLFVDILEDVARREGWRLRYTPAPLPKLLEHLGDETIDILLGAGNVPENEKRFSYSKETILSTWSQVYSREDSKIKSLMDLQGKSIGVVGEADYNHHLRDMVKGFNIHCTFVEFKNAAEILQALKDSWIDAGVLDRLYGMFNERKFALQQTSIVFAPVELRFATLHGENQKLLDAMDYHVKRMKEDPDSLYYRQMNKTLGISKHTSAISKYLIWGLIITFGIMFFLMGMNYLLRKKVGSKTKELVQKNLDLHQEMLDRLQVEEALRESEEKFRHISEQSFMPIAIILDRMFIYVNQAFADLCQYTVEEILTWDFSQYIHLMHAEDRMQFIAPPLKSDRADIQTVHSYLYRVFSQSGKVKWVSHHEKTIQFHGETADLLTLLDVTQLEEAQYQLSEEKERLTVTLRSIGDGVITTDNHGLITMMNCAAEKITGWTQKNALHQPIENVFQISSQRMTTPLPNPVYQVLESGENVEFSSDCILLSDPSLILMVNCAPLRDQEERMQGTVLVLHDITEKRGMENEILKNQRIESIGVLAGGIAHDFNNLMTVVSGNIELVKISLMANERNYQLLEAAEKGVFNAIDLSRQLLTFSKGGAPIKKAAAIGEIIEDSVNFVLSGSTVLPQCHFDPNLFPVDMDKGQISQVFQNLILNSEQAMPGGGVIHIFARNLTCPPLHIPALAPGKYVEISIHDQGIGISKENLDKIFDPFFTTKQTGNGLGLAVVYSIIRKHDGFITVDSTLGQGTDFHIYLPASHNQIESPQQTLPEELFFHGKGKILVMDDNASIRQLLGVTLHKMGFEVSFATTGEEAIDMYWQCLLTPYPFRAVILDLTISGGMGGKEAIVKLLEIDPDVNAIVFSGYSDDPVVANYKNYGFKGTLSKPFRIKDIFTVIQDVIRP